MNIRVTFTSPDEGLEPVVYDHSAQQWPFEPEHWIKMLKLYKEWDTHKCCKVESIIGNAVANLLTTVKGSE